MKYDLQRLLKIYCKKSKKTPISRQTDKEILGRIIGKLWGRSYRIKKVDRENGFYKFSLSRPDIPLRGKYLHEGLVEEIKLFFHPEKEGYSAEAVFSSIYREDYKPTGKMRVLTSSKKGNIEIKFEKGVQKRLIQILEKG